MISLTSYHSGLLQNATPMRYLWQWRWVMKKENIRLWYQTEAKEGVLISSAITMYS